MFTMVQNSHYKNFFTEHYFLRDRFSFSAYLPNYFQKFHSEQKLFSALTWPFHFFSSDQYLPIFLRPNNQFIQSIHYVYLNYGT